MGKAMTAESDDPDDFVRIGEDGVVRRFLRLDGEVRCISDWARLYGQSRFNLNIRLKAGWPIEKAITTPVRHSKMRRSLHVLQEVAEKKEGIQVEEGQVVEVPPEGEVKKAFEKIATDAGQEAVRKAAGAVSKRLHALSSNKRLLILEKEFGERKFQACKRLKKEQRYEQFRLLTRRYADAVRNLRVCRHITFYMALEHFPPPLPFPQG